MEKHGEKKSVTDPNQHPPNPDLELTKNKQIINAFMLFLILGFQIQSVKKYGSKVLSPRIRTKNVFY